MRKVVKPFVCLVILGMMLTTVFVALCEQSGKATGNSASEKGEPLAVGLTDSWTFTSMNTPNQGVNMNDVAWKPGGDYCLIVGPRGMGGGAASRVYRLNDNSATLTQIASDGTYYFNAVDWRPQGDYALVAGSQTYYGIWKYDGTSWSTVFTPVSGGRYNDVAWHPPSGDYALLVGQDNSNPPQSFCHRIDDGASTPTDLNPPQGPAFNTAAWKPDGSYALIGADGALVIFDGTTLTIPMPEGSAVHVKMRLLISFPLMSYPVAVNC